MLHQQAAVLPPGFDCTADAHLAHVVKRLDLPCAAGFQPSIRLLYLCAVFNLLLKNAVFIANRVTVSVNAQRRHAVHIARRQTTQAAVAQTGVILFLKDVRGAIAKVRQCALQRLLHAQIVRIVAQRTADQKFHAQIMHLPFFILSYPVLCFHHPVYQLIADDHGARQINLPLARVRHRAAEIPVQLFDNCLLDSIFTIRF